MITDKEVRVRYQDKETDQSGAVTITISADQLAQTIRRRMAALMPRARILDMAEVPPAAVQLDHTSPKPKARG